MTSKGNKKMGAEMSATKNLVKNEFKQFLGPSIGARPMRAGANAISSSGTGKKTYKADSMTPYLFMGLQQMRTAGGRQALVDSGSFNFSGPPPDTHTMVKDTVSELSGGLLLATHAFVGISFEMGDLAPVVSDVSGDVISSITMTPSWSAGIHGGSDATVNVYPLTPNYSRNLRVKQIATEPSGCHVFFEFSANRLPSNHILFPDQPYPSYEFVFKFKDKSGATEEEKRNNKGFKALVKGSEVFNFAPESTVVSHFKNMVPSNDGLNYDRYSRYAYFLNTADYNPMYFKSSAVSSHGTSTYGVDVCLNYFPTGGSQKTYLPPTSLVLSTGGEISFNIAIQPAVDKVYQIRDLSMTLKNKQGDKIIDHVHYAAGGAGGDVSYHFNSGTYDVSRIFAKPTAVSYLEGKREFKMSLKVNEAVSSTYPLSLSFDKPLWSRYPSWLFGTNDVSYSVGTAPYVALTNEALDVSANASGAYSYVNIQKELVATDFSDVNVQMNVNGPKLENFLSKKVTVDEADVMPLESRYTVDGSSNLADGFKLAATPGDISAHARNKVVFQFQDDVITNANQLKGVAYKVKNTSAWSTIPTNQTLANDSLNYVEASFNVLSDAGYDFQVGLAKKVGTKHPDTVSYEFLGDARGVQASEIYQFPTLKLTNTRTIGGVDYNSASSLVHTDLSYVWALTHSSNSKGVSRLPAEPAVGSTPDFKKKMDISFIDISYHNGVTKHEPSQVQDISLGQLTSTFDLSFINKYPVDTSYDLTYNLRHGDVVYSRDISNFVEHHKF